MLEAYQNEKRIVERVSHRWLSSIYHLEEKNVGGSSLDRRAFFSLFRSPLINVRLLFIEHLGSSSI